MIKRCGNQTGLTRTACYLVLAVALLTGTKATASIITVSGGGTMGGSAAGQDLSLNASENQNVVGYDEQHVVITEEEAFVN